MGHDGAGLLEEGEVIEWAGGLHEGGLVCEVADAEAEVVGEGGDDEFEVEWGGVGDGGDGVEGVSFPEGHAAEHGEDDGGVGARGGAVDEGAEGWVGGVVEEVGVVGAVDAGEAAAEDVGVFGFEAVGEPEREVMVEGDAVEFGEVDELVLREGGEEGADGAEDPLVGLAFALMVAGAEAWVADEDLWGGFEGVELVLRAAVDEEDV
jgi:hypothetical protein